MITSSAWTDNRTPKEAHTNHIKFVLTLGAVLGLAGTSVLAQPPYAGASFGLTVGAPTILGGAHVGGMLVERLDARLGLATNFASGVVLDAELLYAFADDGTLRGYVGGGASVVANQVYLDGSFESTLYALATTGTEYRSGRLGVFAELRGRFPALYVGVAPEVRAGVRYYY